MVLKIKENIRGNGNNIVVFFYIKSFIFNNILLFCCFILCYILLFPVLFYRFIILYICDFYFFKLLLIYLNKLIDIGYNYIVI